MMEKIIPAGSWDFGDVPVTGVKLASRGLRGVDRYNFLEKRAAGHVFADMLDKVALYPGDIPMHAIAIGATEGYGCNRNGDGFDEATCIKQAWTFMSRPLKDYTKEAHNGARYYRHHQNKHPPTSYGYVKLAAYNPRMRRIELLIIGNGTKEAADRNGGLVMLDSTQQKLAGDGDLAWSMACKVAYDVCQNCFNKAATRDNYCTADNCINPHDGFRGLGCQTGLTKVAATGRQQYVENPNALYFDFSEVIRPADRTAYGGIASYLQKAASENYVPGGAELAESYRRHNGYGFDFSWTPCQDKVAYQVQLARNLAELEQILEQSPTDYDYAAARTFAPTMQPSVDLSHLGKAGTSKMASGLKALAERNVLLSLVDFLKLASGADGEKLANYTATVSRHLPGIYNRLVAASDLNSQIRQSVFQPAWEGLPSRAQRDFAEKLAETRSLSPIRIQERVQRSAIRQLGQPGLAIRYDGSLRNKTASVDEAGEYLARQFAFYKLAFLAARPVNYTQLPLTARLCVLQNYIS